MNREYLEALGRQIEINRRLPHKCANPECNAMVVNSDYCLICSHRPQISSALRKLVFFLMATVLIFATLTWHAGIDWAIVTRVFNSH